MDSPVSSTTTASSVTLSVDDTSSSSPNRDSSSTTLDGALDVGLDSTPPTVGRNHGAVWLASSPLSHLITLRYSRRDKLNYDKISVIERVPPVNGIQFRPDTVGKLGWKAYEHPEGSVYFRAANFYTNLWLYDTEAVEMIEEVVEKIHAELAKHPELSGKDIEFGLDLSDDHEPDAAPGDKLGCYYAVDMTNREVFWLHDVSLDFYCQGTETKIISREHLRYGARTGYWDHCYMFPHGRSLSSDAVGDVHAMLSYNMLDKVTSKTSVCPYNADDAHRLCQIFKEMEQSVLTSAEYGRPEHMVMVARMQATLLRDKLIRFHGERYAQLDSNKSVFEEDPKNGSHSGLFEGLSWLFFLRPHTYFEQLSSTWVDNKVNYNSWHNFVGQLQRDWAAYIIPATVILTANVGFLAVPSIDQGGLVATDATVGQIVSYVSTLLNTACVAASLILAEQHRPSYHHNEADIGLHTKYLCDRALSRGGVERLAVIFSIPAAFFRWGLVSFATAILWLCLHDTSVAMRITVCVVTGLSLLLLVMILYNGEWKPCFSTNPLAPGMKRVQGVVKRASVVVATRPKLFSKPKVTIVPEC